MTTSKDAGNKQQQIYVKSKVSKNFVQAPYKILDATNISPAARLLWMFLESNSDEFFPSTVAIVTSLGLSEPTVLNAKKTLLKHNMIFVRAELNAKKAEKHFLYTQDPSVWVDVVYKNARSKPTTKETLAVTTKETLAVTTKEILVTNREPNIEKRIDSRGTGVGCANETVTTSVTKPKKKTTTTNNFPLVGFYKQINKVTGHADPREKNAIFQAELNRLGQDDFSYVIDLMEKEAIKIVWTNPDSEAEIPCERFAEFSDFLLAERAGSG